MNYKDIRRLLLSDFQSYIAQSTWNTPEELVPHSRTSLGYISKYVVSGVFSGQNTMSATSLYLIFNKLYIPTFKCDPPPKKSPEENKTWNKEVVCLIYMNENKINIDGIKTGSHGGPNLSYQWRSYCISGRPAIDSCQLLLYPKDSGR